jgi:cell division protein FtsW
VGEIDYGIFYSVIFLLAIGVIMIYSASSYYAMFKEGDSMVYLKKQLIWAITGLIAMGFMVSFDYHKLKKNYSTSSNNNSTIVNSSIFLSSSKWCEKMDSTWTIIISTIRAYEYVVVLFLAMSLDLKGDGVKKFWSGIVPYLGVSGFFAAMILAEKNLSIAAIIMIVTFIMLFVAGGRIQDLFGRLLQYC